MSSQSVPRLILCLLGLAVFPLIACGGKYEREGCARVLMEWNDGTYPMWVSHAEAVDGGWEISGITYNDGPLDTGDKTSYLPERRVIAVQFDTVYCSYEEGDS